MNDISKRLRELREAKRLSQLDVERGSGVDRNRISRLENGYAVPSLATLQKLSTSLGVTLFQLFYEGKGQPKPPRFPVSVRAEEAPEDDSYTQELRRLIHDMSEANRKLLLNVGQAMAKRGGKSG